MSGWLFLKKLTAIFLSVIMTLLCFLPNTPPVQKGPDYPVVIVRGMNFGGLIFEAGTPQEEDVFKGVDAKELVSVLFKGIWHGLLHWKVSAFTSDVVDYVTDIIGRMACDENGDSVYDVSVPQYEHALSWYPEFVADLGGHNEDGLLKRAVELYGANNVYYYNYDFRLDPFMHAERINTLINNALEETGKKQVDVVSASMGGILMVSYLYRYGCDKIHRNIFTSSTFNGTYVTSDLLQGKVKVTAEGLEAFLRQTVGTDDQKLNGLLNFAHYAGLFKAVEKLATWFVKKAKTQVYDDFLRDTFGTMPILWALVQNEDFDACLKFMFEGREEKYAGLIQKANAYHKMNLQKEAMLRKCMADGMELCIAASYDRALIPVYERANVHSDSVLETPLMLGNATVALRGETLPKDYVPGDARYLSPDRVIDMSPAMFPEYTWAIKGAPHVFCNYGTDCNEFIFWLVNQETQPTVTTSERYPQYMLSSGDEELRLFS